MDVLLYPSITTSNKLQTESYSAANLANSEGLEAHYYQDSFYKRVSSRFTLFCGVATIYSDILNVTQKTGYMFDSF